MSGKLEREPGAGDHVFEVKLLGRRFGWTPFINRLFDWRRPNHLMIQSLDAEAVVFQSLLAWMNDPTVSVRAVVQRSNVPSGDEGYFRQHQLVQSGVPTVILVDSPDEARQAWAQMLEDEITPGKEKILVLCVPIVDILGDGNMNVNLRTLLQCDQALVLCDGVGQDDILPRQIPWEEGGSGLGTVVRKRQPRSGKWDVIDIRRRLGLTWVRTATIGLD